MKPVQKIFNTLLLTCLFSLILTSDAKAAPSLTLLGSDTSTSTTTIFGLPLKTGDINCDGFDDLIIGDMQDDTAGDNFGAVYIYFGGTNPDQTADFVITGEETDSLFPTLNDALATGKINNDDCNNLAIGAYRFYGSGTMLGKIYILNGNFSLSGTISASTITQTIVGGGDLYAYGCSIDISDLNSDSFNELFVAQLGPSPFDGLLSIYNGSSSFDTNADFTLTDTGANSRLGYELTESNFDINNDGYKDIIIKGMSNFGDGKLRIYTGPLENKTQPDIYYTPIDQTDFLARANVAVADYNGDSIIDICMGANSNDTAGTNRGAIYCFWGPQTPGDHNVSSADLIMYGENDNDNFGRSVFSYDVNNDGLNDLLVGAYQTGAGVGNRHGKFFIYLNSSNGLITTPWISIIKNSGDGIFGSAVTAWDLDNDGWTNIAISASLEPTIYFYEITHGTPSISPDEIETTDDPTPQLTGTVSDPDVNVAGVQWSFSNSTTGPWFDCDPTDGAFDSNSEDFICNIDGSELGGGEFQVYIRSFDENDVYAPPQLYGNIEFTIDLPETGSDIWYLALIGLLITTSIIIREKSWKLKD
jgi:hypothetical protein